MLSDLISWTTTHTGHHNLFLVAGCAGCLLVGLLLAQSRRSRGSHQLVAMARIAAASGIAYSALNLFGDERIARNIPHLAMIIGASLMTLSLILLKQRALPSSNRSK